METEKINNVPRGTFQYLNIELTTECNKICPFCERAVARKEGLLKTASMPMGTFDLILSQFKGSIIQFHRDGEPLMYSSLNEIGGKCKDYITNIVTNGKLLMERKDDLKDNFTTITVSVYEDDVQQFNQIKDFIQYTKTPRLLVKFLGDYNNPEFEKMGITTLRRTLHTMDGYSGALPPIPELGMCLDFLMKPSIDINGDFFICNRYDPECKGILGNVHNDSLNWIWNSPLRMEWLEAHKQGKRDLIPLCKNCKYWGCPTNG